jgi:hypothetical protein
MDRTAPDESSDIIALSNRLRMVRTACKRFIFLWAMSQSQNNSGSGNDLAWTLDNLKNSADPDWTFLHTPHVCDD